MIMRFVIPRNSTFSANSTSKPGAFPAAIRMSILAPPSKSRCASSVLAATVTTYPYDTRRRCTFARLVGSSSTMNTFSPATAHSGSSAETCHKARLRRNSGTLIVALRLSQRRIARMRPGTTLCGGFPDPDQRPDAGPHRPHRGGPACFRRRAVARPGRGTERRGRGQVARARAAQRTRYGEDGPTSNAEADSRDVEMAADAHALAEQAMEKLRLSPRGYTRVLRVGRTIADLAGATVVQRPHVAEALAFRHRMPGRKW